MASRYEIEVTVTSAKDLKNVNWKYGPNRPYAVVWVDPAKKCTTRVDEEGDTFPVWEQTLTIPLPPGVPIEDQTLFVDIVHAKAEEDTKPLIGSAKLRLRDALDDAGFGERIKKTLQLKRPSGRPHGKLDLKVLIRENRYQPRDAYAPPYEVPPPSQTGTRDFYGAPPAYATPYTQPPNPYYSAAAAAPPTGYPYSAAAPPVQSSYGYGQQSGYGQQYGYGQQQQPVVAEKKSKFGMGTGLAVGAVGGILGGLALSEGVDALEDHVADEAAERVEEDAYEDSGDW